MASINGLYLCVVAFALVVIGVAAKEGIAALTGLAKGFCVFMLSLNGDGDWLMSNVFLLWVGSFGFHLNGILVFVAVNRFRYLKDILINAAVWVWWPLESRALISVQWMD